MRTELAETRVGVTFADKNLLAQAFTHRSYINEHRDLKRGHNERLEYLGDAVLELIVTAELYAKFPEKPEGDLTTYRAALVNTVVLSEAAEALGFNDLVLLSKGEARDQGRARKVILADAYEAVVGAIYLDQGYDAAKAFAARTLLPRLAEVAEKGMWLDAKSKFQEKAQDLHSTTPSYRVITEEGPDHDKCFTVAAMIGKEEVAQGEGKSKQEAEQDAARAALKAKGWL